MTSSTQSPSGIFRDMWKGIQIGGAIMLLQTPPITAFNRVSVVCCYHDLPMLESVKWIFQGRADAATKPSIGHYFKGVSGHLLKETLRLGGKGPLIVTKPRLDHHLGKFSSDLVFACGLSAVEIVVNPADTVRTMWQAGQRVTQVERHKLFGHLYKGACSNGLRLFGIGLGFPTSERVWSQVVERVSSLDSHTMWGIFAKALPQSFQITAPIWIFERLQSLDIEQIVSIGKNLIFLLKVEKNIQ